MVYILVPMETTSFLLLWLKTLEALLMKKSLSQTLEAEGKVLCEGDAFWISALLFISQI